MKDAAKRHLDLSPKFNSGEMMLNDAAIIKNKTDLRLTPRYWSLAGAVLASQLFEFFDFYIVGFVVSMIAKPWHLTFGESAVILLTTGAGAIVGSLLWGWLGDRFGRRPALIASILTFAIGTGISAFTPTGWWWMLAIFRGVVGMGVGGGNTVGPPLIVEFTPTKHRVVMSGLATVALVPLGGVFISIIAATLGPAIGFRGLLLLGFLPVLIAVWAWWAVPESPRWLLSKGRKEEADAVVNRIFDVEEGCGTTFKIEASHKTKTGAGFGTMIQYRASFWSTALVWLFADSAEVGIELWGPTLLVQVLDTTPSQAATLFIGVTFFGFLGRLAFPFIASILGRRGAGMIMGGGGAIVLALCGFLHSMTIGTISAFYIFLVLSFVFIDGGWTNLVPSTAEVWPAELRARGQGLGNAFGGIGKIVGPAILGLVAGSSNLITPHAAASAVTPAFLLFAGCSFVVFLTYLFISPETAHTSLEQIALSVVDSRQTGEGPVLH